MTILPNNFQVNKEIHDRKVLSITEKFRYYNMDFINTDIEFETMRMLNNQGIPFSDSKFRSFNLNGLSWNLSYLFSNYGSRLFSRYQTQKMPDLITIAPNNITFLDIKLLTREHPNSTSININSYEYYCNLAL